MRACGGWLLISVSTSSYAVQTAMVVGKSAPEEGVAPFTQRIDKIYINIGDVFDTQDPKENNALYRLANTLHINTRESVVHNIILFKSGDIYSIQQLAESERLLRNQAFIYDAVIRPVNIRPDKVDIQIFTRDVWTLAPGGSFSREGGENSSSFELEESNFLGYGKHMKVRSKKGVERSENSYRYDDPNLLGSRHTLSLLHSNNSDGQRSGITFLRPFYALEAKKSYGFSWLKDDRVDTEFDDFGTAYNARHQDDFWESFIGVSHRIEKDRTLRLTYGYTYDQHRYSPIGDANEEFIPEDIRDSYPWMGIAYVEDRFIKSRRIHFLNRTEDVNLGHDANLRIGWTDHNIGSLNDGLIIRGGYQYNAIMHKGALLSHEFKIDGRIVSDRWVDALISSRTEYFFKKDPKLTNYVSLQLDYGRDLSAEKILVLGGDTGLRGYPLDMQQGDNRFIFTYEKRFYYDVHIMRLIHVGSVIFFDIGRAWDTGGTYANNQGVLKDIGFGLRMESSKSGKNQVYHIDFAMPLDGNDSIKDYQITAKTESTF